MASIAFDLIVLGVVVIGLLKLLIRQQLGIGLHCGLVLQYIDGYFHIFLLMETGYSQPLAWTAFVGTTT